MARKRKQENSVHRIRMDFIRPYVTFNYKNPTAYQKRKIKTYYDEIAALAVRPHHVYRPRKKERLKIAQQYAQHEKNLPGLKVAFIPTDGKHRPRLRFNDKKKSLTVTTNHVSSKNIPFDIPKLIADPDGHIAQVMTQDARAAAFTIQAGKYEIPKALDKDFVPREVKKLMAKYGNEDANNYFGNWLWGLKSHHFHEQDDLDDYLIAKQKARQENKRKRAARSKKIKRVKHHG